MILRLIRKIFRDCLKPFTSEEKESKNIYSKERETVDTFISSDSGISLDEEIDPKSNANSKPLKDEKQKKARQKVYKPEISQDTESYLSSFSSNENMERKETQPREKKIQKNSAIKKSDKRKAIGNKKPFQSSDTKTSDTCSDISESYSIIESYSGLNQRVDPRLNEDLHYAMRRYYNQK